MAMNDEIRRKALEVMQRDGLTQQDIAKRSGVRQATVSRFLTGALGKPGSVEAILDALGLELVVRERP